MRKITSNDYPLFFIVKCTAAVLESPLFQIIHVILVFSDAVHRRCVRGVLSSSYYDLLNVGEQTDGAGTPIRDKGNTNDKLLWFCFIHCIIFETESIFNCAVLFHKFCGLLAGKSPHEINSALSGPGRMSSPILKEIYKGESKVNQPSFV